MKYDPTYVRGIIKLISKDKLETKPDFATIGGYSVKTANGETVVFDWQQHEGNHFKTDDGRIGIVFETREFDTEHFTANNEHSGTPDWDDILNGELVEVYYEAGYLDESTQQETDIPFELQTFAIAEYPADSETPVFREFTEEKVAAYNKRVEKAFATETT